MVTVKAKLHRGILFDALAVLAVAALLVTVHYLVPAAVRDGFALQYGQPDPLHAFTGAYVHLTDAHLYANVAGLLAGGAWAILLSHLAGERRWFRFSLAWFLVGLPVAVGLSGAALVDDPITTRGFSGVVAGFAGFGLVGLGVVLHRTFGVDRWLAWDAVAGLTIVVAAEILWLVTGPVSPLAGGILGGGVGLTLVPFARAGLRSGWPAGRERWARLAGAVAATVLLSALVVVFVVGLFPTEVARDGSVTNVLSHYLGLVYGAVIAGWGYRYWSVGGPRGRANRRS